MFLTQVNPKRAASSTHLSTHPFTHQRSKNQSTSFNSTPKHGYSLSAHRSSNVAIGFERTFSSLQNRLTAQEKWKRIVQLFDLGESLDSNADYRVPTLYSCLLRVDLQMHRFSFAVPETVLVDQQGILQLLHTVDGEIRRRPIVKSEVSNILEKGHEATTAKLKQTNRYSLYGEQVDVKVNPNAPFVVIRWQRGDGSVEIENIRNFGENRWRATPECLVQRYLYSRNLKAMVLRVEYTQARRGEQHQEYCVHRFQNVACIFRTNSNGLCDSHDLRAKVSPSFTRPNTLEYSKLTGPGVLQRFVKPASEVRRLLQRVSGKRVVKICVDVVEDLTGALWVVGFKGVQFQAVSEIPRKQQWLIASQVGYCRLCNGLFQKSQLQNSVSVRMLLQFLHHLRRRTRAEDLESVEFVSALSLNRKENAMSAVCECCYALIIHELELKKYERQLGRLCHIRVSDEATGLKSEAGELRQWRLMVYLEEIKEVSKGVGKLQNVVVRYALGRGIEEKWKCSHEQGTIPVKRVKIHYFFSEGPDIEDFLKNAEILVSVLTAESEEVIAQGSTGVLANFKNKFVVESGQRQTTTVLLFFQSGKYCELTLKVGLVYDGLYRAPEVSLRKFHSVLFPTRDCLNSNPLPKQWMQAFGYDQEIQIKEVKYDQIFKNKKQEGKKNTQLKKKTLRNY